MSTLFQDIRKELDAIPVFDVHSHYGNYGYWQAKSLADIVSYHWLSIELGRSAGTPFPSRPPADEEAYMAQLAPLFRNIRNTGNHYALRHMLKDLYGFDEPCITPDNWRDLDAKVRANGSDLAWQAKVLDTANILKVMVTRADGTADTSDRWLLYDYGEWFCRPTTRKELAPCFGSEDAISESIDDLAEAIDTTITGLVKNAGIGALHIWLSDAWSYRAVQGKEVQEDYRHLLSGAPVSRDQVLGLSGFCTRQVAKTAAENGIILQVFHGTEMYNQVFAQGFAGAYNPEFLPSMAKLCLEVPEAKVDVFLSTRIPSHEAATISRVTPNLCISGAWWQGFTPTTLSTFFRDRFEILPMNTWNAFYSDGYLVEWIYAKLIVVKQRLAMTLAGLVEEDYLTFDTALEAARCVLWDNPLAWYGVDA